MVVFVAGRLDAREARGAVLSVIRRYLHLTSESNVFGNKRI
jgi:hypothetical protein